MAADLPKTMQAWKFTSVSPTLEENLSLDHISPLPDNSASLRADQVLVNVLAASLNPIDYKSPEIPFVGRLVSGSPSIPGIDFAGRVAATGPNRKNVASEDLKVGQLVYGRLKGPTKFGTLAEYTIAPRAACVPIPPGVSVIDAASAATAGLTAYQSIMPKIKGGTGERVFINGGSGGCGTFGIQIAKVAGCHVTTSCSTANVELCKSLGADIVIDYSRKDVVAELKKMQPFDLVVDNIGSPAITPGFILRNLYKKYWPSRLGGGKRRWEFMHLENKPEDFSQIARWMQEKKVRAVVADVYGMEDKGPVEAFTKLRIGRTRGKIVVKIVDSCEE
ncbi:NAD(P)-dependent alcohol dehydrogenase [Aspergillus tanneri]|uniref:Enoyl reductase (ER) domain-containing protein n=1 Tax=Aspergillus tanneri TaxID=1220188 RepID=A0A5M9MIN3_9EURO|nr:uncharacterized protein ATNIH1004_005536 [Aspergillus tanneri]KAA8646861.1 hypothetical protein ATNIH1004_005536 [Aspergillus tanneri]